MSLGPVHLVFGSSGQAPEWFAAALREHGAVDSHLITTPGGERVWVHHGAEVPITRLTGPVKHALVREDVRAGKAYREVKFGARPCAPLPGAVLVPDFVPDGLLGGAS